MEADHKSHPGQSWDRGILYDVSQKHVNLSQLPDLGKNQTQVKKTDVLPKEFVGNQQQYYSDIIKEQPSNFIGFLL